ncbi:GNAT family N-acetyltransferase [Oceanospirillum sanctuarii]|uniref:GNAT family N-acetyltransferase n=1 Tax=Oceanospirillum sanctuarii TaxID=1434821 RepID=UPI000A3B15E1|nr:GNAT family N-acetyltransferase [Oceanospirillum sanctuarii]
MKIRFIDNISQIDDADWQRLLNTDNNPFIGKAFLLALESSGAASEKGGWKPHHLTVESDDGLIAFMPLYLKTHSYGEYVFDWSWADAYQRYGLAYYPKLVTAIPYTPSQGERLLVADGIQKSDLLPLIVDAVKAEAMRLGASGWHLLFPQEDEHQLLANQQLHTRLTCQFHWFNTDNWQDFDQFLASFSSKKRKNVKQERRKVAEQGFRLARVEGTEITPEQLEHFYHCYHITYLQRGRQGYLNRSFFQQLVETMPEQMMLVIAYDSTDAPVAAALFFHDNASLYGRYWGSKVEADSLHFEACYYQGIEYCLERGLKHFDPGTQGEHKISRGFHPILTWSNHWLAEPGFDDAIRDFVEEEAEHVQQYAEHACDMLPFKE